ncbi:hypothetical protein AB0O22_26295 [Streptomyces sp. NPDC091204]|uniref:hypothetical protein n=1 Tax=Streptomyces sp. NPDC091204 TaxID=3155299 RepID=UPI0034186DF7
MAGADPDLVDVIVGTGVIERSEVWPGAGPGTMSAVPRFAGAEEDYGASENGQAATGATNAQFAATLAQ